MSETKKQGHGDKWSRKHEQAIAALLTSPTISDAATKAGVHHMTLRCWLKEPEFLAAFNEAKKDLLDRTIASLQCMMLEAMEALRKDFTNKSADVRFRAISLVLEKGMRAIEIRGLNEQLAELQSAVFERIALLQSQIAELAAKAAKPGTRR